MASQAIKKQVDIIKSIIRFVINFITDHIAAWIIERGGWVSCYLLNLKQEEILGLIYIKLLYILDKCLLLIEKILMYLNSSDNDDDNIVISIIMLLL